MSNKLIPTLLGLSITTPSIGIVSSYAIASTSPNSSTTDRVVFIKTRSGQGSGVIIKRVDDTYTILTAAHVVNDLGNSPVEIITPDRQKYTTAPSEVKIAPDLVDLATVTFQSQQHYAVAELGDSNSLSKGQRIFAAGFQGQSLKFSAGTVVAISRQSQDKGYGLAIGTADILPGMSGGGLFNEMGNLIGINGKSIGSIEGYTNSATARNHSKPVSGLAIPINTFDRFANQLNVGIDRKSILPATAELTADDLFITAGTKSQKGDYRGAIVDYDRALAINPQFGEVYFRRGIARTLVKDWQGAVADYTRASELNPDHLEVYLNRGNVRNILKDWQGAKSDFDLAIAFNPKSLPAYVGRGVALCELNDCQSGLQDYHRAIALNPSYADAYSRRGFAYHRLGNRKAAIDNYLVAAELYRQQGKNLDYLETAQKLKQLVRG